MKQTFPTNFLWGASISAHQTEGAYQTDGKGLSVQDTRPRDNHKIADFTVAVDHYHQYKEDIALLAEMGIKIFRFPFFDRLVANFSRRARYYKSKRLGSLQRCH